MNTTSSAASTGRLHRTFEITADPIHPALALRERLREQFRELAAAGQRIPDALFLALYEAGLEAGLEVEEVAA